MEVIDQVSMPRRKTVRSLADLSMSGLIQLVSLYSEQVSRASYIMTNIATISDAKIQDYLDNRVEWFKAFLFSSKCLIVLC